MLRSIFIQNYRKFGSNGAVLPFDHEFVGILGVNNAGKSSLLRVLFELRPIFDLLVRASTDTTVTDIFSTGIRVVGPNLAPGEKIHPSWDPSVEPRITVEFARADQEHQVKQLTISLTRTGHTIVRLQLFNESTKETLDQVSAIRRGPQVLLRGTNREGKPVHIDWGPVAEDLRSLTRSRYVGPFRNAINSGGGSYYDLSVGESFIAQFDEFKNGPIYKITRPFTRCAVNWPGSLA